MKLSLTLSLASVLLGLAGTTSAQLATSHALTYAGNRMTISLKLNGATVGISVGVSVSAATGLTFTAPATVAVDARGYAQVNVDVQSAQANLSPKAFTVTLAHPSFNNGQITRDYVVKSVGGAIGSAWPDVIMVQGVFCNPPASAATMLEIDRASDLDGDGAYGDVNVEAGVFDPLDAPSEFSTDVDLADTATGCVTGTPPNVFWPGATGRTVAFMTDNRLVTGACGFTSQLNFAEDVNFAPNFGGSPALLMPSSSADKAFIGRDSNGDGSVDASEIRVFFDPAALVNMENYSPDNVVYDRTGTRRAYWISDKAGPTGSPTNQGIFQLNDANGDDQIGAGEFRATWTGTSGVVVVEAQNVDHTEFEALHVDSFGATLVNQTALGTIFRWRDANADGIANTGEVSNWLTYAATSAYTRSADFQTAGFPVVTGPYFGLNHMESVFGAGFASGDVYYLGSTNNATGGQGNGFVFRCEDRNVDGDVNDLGEVSIYVDPTQITDPTRPEFNSGLAVGVIDLNGNTLIDANEQFVYVADADGNNPRPFCGFTAFGDLCVWRFNDKNGDGDALDAGENERVMIHPTGAFNRGLEVVPDALSGGFRHTFYQRSSLVTIRAASCRNANGDALEVDHLREKLEEGTQGTPFGGNQRFALVTRGNGSSAIAAGLLLSGAVSPAPFQFSGCDVWAAFPFFPDLIPAVAPDANGKATFPVPIPAGVLGTLVVQAFAVSPSLQITIGETAEMRVR